MTFQEFLDLNRKHRFEGYGYDESEVYDKKGNILTCWYENDPKYQAKVLRMKYERIDLS